MKNVLEMFGEPITYGGQESVVYNMLSTLDMKNDYNVDLFTPYYADNAALINLVSSNGGKIYHKDIEFKTGDNRFLLKKDIIDFFDHNNKIYDVVHIHTGSLSTMCLYSKIAKRYGAKKVIVHAHIAGQGDKESIFHKIQKYILCKMLYRYADVYIGCSKKAIDFKWTKKIIDKAIVVNNGIDIEKYSYSDAYRKEIRDRYNISRDKIVIGNVARFTYQKNHIFMIDILKRLLVHDKNITLMLLGDGENIEKIKQHVNDNDLQASVIFTQNVSDAYRYYNAFDIYILPSLFEGLPVTAIEAEINKLPVLLSDTISKECKISDNISFLSINDVDIWTMEIRKLISIIKNDKYRRDDVSIKSDIYDKKHTYKIIDNIYKI